jgi:hypothetical protein
LILFYFIFALTKKVYKPLYEFFLQQLIKEIIEAFKSEATNEFPLNDHRTQLHHQHQLALPLCRL